MYRLKHEFKQIKWIKPLDAVKQTLFILVVMLISGMVLTTFDTSIQALIGLVL